MNQKLRNTKCNSNHQQYDYTLIRLYTLGIYFLQMDVLSEWRINFSFKAALKMRSLLINIVFIQLLSY